MRFIDTPRVIFLSKEFSFFLVCGADVSFSKAIRRTRGNQRGSFLSSFVSFIPIHTIKKRLIRGDVVEADIFLNSILFFYQPND